MWEMMVVPYETSFWACLCFALCQLGIYDDYTPILFAAGFLSRIPIFKRTEFPLYNVMPRVNLHLFEEVANVFDITLYIFTCNSQGFFRSLSSLHGKGVKDVCLLFVSDVYDFTIPSLALTPTKAKIMSQESKEVLEVAREALRQRGGREATPLPSISDTFARATDPFAPPHQAYPMPKEANRWVYLANASVFLQGHNCRRGCGGMFSTASNRAKHEELACTFDPTLPADQQDFCRHRYPTNKFEAKRRLQEDFFSIGYHLSPSDLAPKGLMVYDCETSQIRSENEIGGRKTEIRFLHNLFSLGFAWCLGSDQTQVESRVLYRAKFLDDYSMVSEWVNYLVELAQKHAALMREETRDLWRGLEADEAGLLLEAPQGFHIKRLRKTMRKLRYRQSTFTLGGWNSSR
jgi:hypothetical protein